MDIDLALNALVNDLRHWPRYVLLEELETELAFKAETIAVLEPSVGFEGDFFIDVGFSFRGMAFRVLMAPDDQTPIVGEGRLIGVSVIANGVRVADLSYRKSDLMRRWTLYRFDTWRPGSWQKQISAIGEQIREWDQSRLIGT